MKIAIMQPYFFPYIGYFQLANSVDEFVFFDDVNFIKKGFIHRNNILLNKEKFQFSIPVTKVSQNRKINEHFYKGEFDVFIKQVEAAYKNAPFFADVYPIISSICTDANENVAKKNALSIKSVFNYLGIPFVYSFSSILQIRGDIRAQDRIIEICKKKTITRYVNASGGKELYEYEKFLAKNIQLSFLATKLPEYEQSKNKFVIGLSIIDALMYCDKEAVIGMINAGRLE